MTFLQADGLQSIQHLLVHLVMMLIVEYGVVGITAVFRLVYDAFLLHGLLLKLHQVVP